MSELAERIAGLRTALTAAADPERAPAMAAYMQGRFPFLGVTAPERRVAQRPFVAGGRDCAPSALIAAADACWSRPEREFQYVGVDLLRRWVDRLRPGDLVAIGGLIRRKSWWDTVDPLAINVVGPLVAAEHRLLRTMDEWIADDDIWIARSAILFQLRYREQTDADRLFRYIDRRSADREFFIRKAAGWALREHAKSDPDAVRRYVADRGDRLSPLTRREATRHL